MSKTTVVVKGIFMLFTVWLTWYAIIGSLVGPLDDAFYPMASQYPDFMAWYPIMSMLVNYSPVIASFAIIVWMLYKGNSDTYENEKTGGGFV